MSARDDNFLDHLSFLYKNRKSAVKKLRMMQSFAHQVGPEFEKALESVIDLLEKKPERKNGNR